ncbi:hypothetical protein DP73_18910 [Desulfosporosinus sp. HMP52]|nr:hypothetical protein DP73_18910 [Desulfosporosinus sp. HMP52]
MANTMIIGIPRALLYHKYKHLWKSFFKELGIDYILSPDTNKEILRKGSAYSIDESCLSSKIYLGHVEWLLDKCDYILIPRFSDYSRNGTVCPKFLAIYDVVANIFRDRSINLLSYSINPKVTHVEMAAFLKLGKILNKKKSQSLYAYLNAKQVEKKAHLLEITEQERLLQENKLKILVLAHRYNIFDKYIGEPILNILREQETVPIIGDIAPQKEAIANYAQISETLPWVCNRELVGSIPIYKDRVDGIILMSAFPCGPDSLVNEILIRRIKDKPILNLMIDGQEGKAGMETRLESFIDIIRFKKDEQNGRN